MNLKNKHFYNTLDFSQKEVNFLINLALKMKTKGYKKNLIGKSIAMLFFNPSLRTRLSFAAAMLKLGGLAIDLPVSDGGSYTFEFENGITMDKSTKEHVKEASKVISRYCDVIGIRAGELITNATESVQVPTWTEVKQDKVIKSFMKYATVPLINMESNVWHPCQGLGDAMTIKEKISNPKGKKFVLTWAYHPKALPMAVPNSQILAACDLGMNTVIVHPKGWDLDPQIMKTVQKRAEKAGGSLAFTNSIEEAFKNAHVVCTKSWGALKYYGQWEKEKEIRKNLKHWIVDDNKMSLTHNAYFMHCLPVRRNVEVTDKVIDSKQSLVVDQAENRMWAQMALLSKII